MAENAPDRDALLEDIQALTATGAPLLEQVERTLADGYACALGIEARRLRLQRQLEDRAARLDEAAATQRVDEVAGIARGIARADDELAELRTALTGLAALAQRIRAA